jgi:hypothetical protein
MMLRMKERVTISVSPDALAVARAEVANGKAPNLSVAVERALEAAKRREALQDALRLWEEEFGPIGREAEEWADRELKRAALIKRGMAWGLPVVLPATALAQVWRAGPRSARLASLLGSIDVDSLDEGRGKEVGARLGLRDNSDVADAHVVCCALEVGATVATSDPDDIRALADSDERLVLIAV